MFSYAIIIMLLINNINVFFTNGEDKILSPQCSSITYKRELTSANSKLNLGTWKTSVLWIFCFGYEFVDDSPTKNSSLLSGAKVYISVKMDDQNNESSSQYIIPIVPNPISGSMLTQVTYFNSQAKVTFYAEVPQLKINTNKNNKVNLYFTTEIEINSREILRRYHNPFLINIKPRLVFRGMPVTLYYAVPRHYRVKYNSRSDALGVGPAIGSDCSQIGQNEWPAVNHSTGLKYSFESSQTEEELPVMTWTYNFQTGGLFRICANFEREGWFTLGLIDVFGSNPSYFIISSILPGGGLKDNTPYVITFVGTNFDLAPDGDCAKLASVMDDCVNGLPAGGTEMSCNLGPDDSVYDNDEIKRAYYPITITIPGAFHVCYYLKSEQKWVSVQHYDELPPGSKEVLPTLPPIETTTPTPTTTIINFTTAFTAETVTTTESTTTTPPPPPTTTKAPNPFEPTSTLPTTTVVPLPPECYPDPLPWPLISEKNPIIVMTIKSDYKNDKNNDIINDAFREKVAKLLCITLSTLFVYEVRVEGDFIKAVIGIDCKKDPSEYCNSINRITVLKGLYDEGKLQKHILDDNHLTIIDLKVVSGSGINTNTNNMHGGSSVKKSVIDVKTFTGITVLVVIILCIITFILVIGLVAYYRRKQNPTRENFRIQRINIENNTDDDYKHSHEAADVDGEELAAVQIGNNDGERENEIYDGIIMYPLGVPEVEFDEGKTAM